MARVLTGPARCIECRAVWRAVHLASMGEDCIRCGGSLELLEPGEPGSRFAHPRTAPWGWKRSGGTPGSRDPGPRSGLGV